MAGVLESEKLIEDCKHVAYVREFAKILYENYIRDNQYSVIDKLAYATSPHNLLVALYEALRGIKKSEERMKVSYIIRIIAENVSNENCVEEALKIAKRVAVEALAYAERVKEGGKGEEGEEEERKGE
jgi:hypothetical protein